MSSVDVCGTSSITIKKILEPNCSFLPLLLSGPVSVAPSPAPSCQRVRSYCRAANLLTGAAGTLRGKHWPEPRYRRCRRASAGPRGGRAGRVGHVVPSPRRRPPLRPRGAGAAAARASLARPRGPERLVTVLPSGAAPSRGQPPGGARIV